MQIECIVHDFDKSQSINFVRDTAIERRSLTSAQGIDIILRSSDLIDEIVGQAKERQLSGLKKGTRPLQSKDVNGDGKETNSKLAELANSSTATVQRMKKVKKENPQNCMNKS